MLGGNVTLLNLPGKTIMHHQQILFNPCCRLGGILIKSAFGGCYEGSHGRGGLQKFRPCREHFFRRERCRVDNGSLPPHSTGSIPARLGTGQAQEAVTGPVEADTGGQIA